MDSDSSPSSPISPNVADHPQSPDVNENEISSSPVMNLNQSDDQEEVKDKSDSRDEEDSSVVENDTSKEENSEDSKPDEAVDSDVSDDEVRPSKRKAIIDSDDDDNDSNNRETKKSKAVDSDAESDNEDSKAKNSDSDEESETPNKKSKVISDDSDVEDKESDAEDDENQPSGSKTKLDKQKEAEEIFGDSESEDEEFEGFKKAGEDQKDDDESDDEQLIRKRKRTIDDSDSDSDSESGKKSKQNDEDKEEQEGVEGDAPKVLPEISSSSEDELDDDDRRRSQTDGLVYDFDIMMAKRKEQNARNRKRKNTDIINDSDDIIADLIQQMKQAAEDDFELNKDRKAATRKMKLLPLVQTQLRKIDLREAFLDAGVLGVITDWLTPLPDRSLPNLQVRETMLKILIEFNIMDVERLKASGIGKAVMYLFKHPKEIKDNKKRAGQLISNWARPIFNCETDYHSISKEDREQRDFDHMNKMSKKMRNEEQGRKEEETQPPSGTLRPGDKGWVPRARVPAPSTRDYVVRPKSTVEIEMSRTNSKKPVSRLEKHLRNFQEKKRAQKTQRAVKISIEGRKL